MSPFVVANPFPIAILTYHQIAPTPPKGTPFRSLCVSPQAFARQMAALKLLGFRGLSMAQLEPYLEGRLQGRVFGITLDDGYLNNLTHALPVLQRHGFSATCYLVSGMLGQSNLWDRDIGIPPAALMDAAQVQQWLAGGQDIGAHSRHHTHLTQLQGAALDDEVRGSRAELEALFERPVLHFCYPYGSFNQESENAAAAAGFRTSTTTRRGRVLAGQHRSTALPRVPVHRTTTLPALLWKMWTTYEDAKA